MISLGGNMEQKYLRLIGDMIHYNELEYRDVFKLIIASINYQNHKEESKYINNKLKEILDVKKLNFKDIIEYAINQNCVEYLALDETNQLCDFLKINHDYLDNNYLDIECNLWHTKFAEDLVEDKIVLTFENIKNKSFYSKEKYSIKIDYKEELYFRNMEIFDKTNKMKNLYLYYLPQAEHFIINISDTSEIKKAVSMGEVYIDKNLDRVENMLLLLKYSDRLRLKI